MYVEFFQLYPGGHDKDPGYADFRVNCGGRRYVASCLPDGTLTKHGVLRTASAADWNATQEGRGKAFPFRKVAERHAADMRVRIESVVKTYVRERSLTAALRAKGKDQRTLADAIDSGAIKLEVE